MITLHRPWFDHREEEAVVRVVRSRELAGNGEECHGLERELSSSLGGLHVFAVSSASHALEMAMEALDVRGGEVVLPSFTFPSVANAVLRAGATPVFCDVREPDLNVDLDDAASVIGTRTRALVVTHYGGHPVLVPSGGPPCIEDAAHALGSRIDGRACGTLGVVGCLSFHATKNCAAGEGGAMLCHEESVAAWARVLREKGTNRDDFVAGKVAKYTWVAVGSSYVMSELSAAVARVQLSKLDTITRRRRAIARTYDEMFEPLERSGRLRVVRPVDGDSCYHVYAVLVDPRRRDDVIASIRARGVETASHFEPLHLSPFGRRLARRRRLVRTKRLAASVLRLPMYPELKAGQQERVVEALERCA